jgi:hypothetical protein
MRIKATLLAGCYLIIAGLVLMECDPFQMDEIPAEKQLVFDATGRTTHYILPNTSTVVDLQSIVETSFSTITLKVTAQPERGHLSLLGDHILMYEPTTDFTTGHDQFIYSAISVDKQVIKSDTVHIMMGLNVDDFPCDVYAIEDYASIKPGTSVSVSFLDNDRLCGTGSANISKTTLLKPKHGTATLTDDIISYTADPGYEGWDQVVYQLSSAAIGAEDVTVTLGLISILVKEEPCTFEVHDDSFYYKTVYLNPNPPPPAQVEFDMLANDVVCSLDSWHAFIEKGPLLGTAQLMENGRIRYETRLTATTIRDAFVDSITYRLCYKGECKQAVAVIKIGSRWTLLQPPSLSPLLSTWFANENIGYVGSQENIYKTIDGGVHWIPMLTPDGLASNGLSSFDAADLFFLNSQHGWAIGTDGLVGTADGGETWQYLNNLPGTSVFFTSSLTGYATSGNSAGTVYKTLDGGHTWHTTNVPAPTSGLDIFDVVFTNSSTGYARTTKHIIRSNDSGENWFICFTQDPEWDILSLIGRGPDLYMTWTGLIYTGIPEYVEGSFVSRSQDGFNWFRGNSVPAAGGHFAPRFAWGSSFSPTGDLGIAYGATSTTADSFLKIYISTNQASTWQVDELFGDGYFVNKTVMAAAVPTNKVAYLVGNNVILKYDAQ